MTELEAAMIEFKAAVDNNDEDAAELVLVGPFEFLAMEEEPWSDALFQAVVEILGDERVVRTRLSSRLVMMIDLNWENLTAAQRGALRGILTAAFCKTFQLSAAVNIVDLFAERYGDLQALETLERFVDDPQFRYRGMAAYGLGKWARTVGTEPLRQRVIERLKALENDSDEQVRLESGAELSKLLRFGR